MSDLAHVLKKAAQNTNKGLRRKPLGILMPILLSLVFSLINSLGMVFYSFSMLGGFILAILYAILISMGMRFYHQFIHFDRLDTSFLEGWKEFFVPVYGIYFLLMFVKILGKSIGMTPPLLLGLYLFLNPLPEVIYTKGATGLEGPSYAMEFQRENFLYWMIPLIIYLTINIGLLGKEQVLAGILSTDVINQMTGLSSSISLRSGQSLIMNILSLLLTGYYMIYRGHLFKILSTSSKRKRQYMGGIND